MSIHAILYRIAAKRLGGIIPSTSTGVLSFPSATVWKNVDNRRNFSSNTYFDVAAELQGHPIVQWFERSIKASCNYAQNLIENSGLTTVLIRIATLYLPTLILWKRIRFEKVQLPFLYHIRSRVGSIILYSSSVGLFLTQYCGIKKMAEVIYPSWTASGTLSFIDLTVPDPAFLLPTLTAICFTFAIKRWIETLQVEKAVSSWMLGLKPDNAIYPIAACSLLVASNVPSVVCVYWITSSLISGMHATVLRTDTVRTLLHLHSVYSDPSEIRRAELLNYVSEMRQRRANETLEIQKEVAEIKTENQGEELFKSLVKEAENIRLERDSLFRQSWRENAVLPSSKIAKLMEQHIQEAARANVVTKARKPKSRMKADSQKFEIDEITAS
uniref:Mitochondrial inner membrane protein COX18 n=1 Tax=Loa loa TaxID=7209 RepID=A0A1I7W562_LOALO